MAKPMSLEEAYIVAQQLSPLPSVAHDAMKVLVAEIERLQVRYENAVPGLETAMAQACHAHYEDNKTGRALVADQQQLEDRALMGLSRVGVFGGLPFITDPTLAPDEIAVVQGGKRVVFRLDMEKGTADVVREEALR